MFSFLLPGIFIRCCAVVLVYLSSSSSKSSPVLLPLNFGQGLFEVRLQTHQAFPSRVAVDSSLQSGLDQLPALEPQPPSAGYWHCQNR